MTIRTRLKIITIIAIGSVLVVGSFFVATNRESNKLTRENNRINEIVKGVFELNIITNDYLLHRDERSRDQWWLRYNSIARLLIEEEIGIPQVQKRKFIASLRESHKKIASTFFQLVTVLGREGLSRDAASTALEERLIEQLSVETQAMVSNSFLLAKLVRQRDDDQQQWANSIALIAIVILAFVIGAISILAFRTILKPLTKLHKGSEIIGAGNLEHRIDIKSKDEIGQLAMSFNDMTTKLQKSYGALEEKVRERTAELEIAKNKSEALLASMGDGVFAIDREQNVVHLNARGEELSGYAMSEVLGKPYYDVLKFVKEKDGTENLNFIRNALKGKLAKMEDHTYLLQKDGHKLPVADSASPLKNKDGEIIGAMVVFRDASEERELDKMREQIVNLTNQQLRNPITIIKRYAELLMEEDLPKEALRQVAQISLVTTSMHELINDLLDLSRMEQGKIDMAPAPTRLEDLVKGITKGLKEISEKEGKAIRIGETKALPKVSIDAKHVSEALSNVISNAVKYTKDEVYISFEETDGFVQFSCTDNGLGIPKDEQYSIFKNFFRASNVKKTEGTGLGLSIAKAIVEKSGGKIWFESEESKGTTFYISLPVA